jgi:predicted  nucleic acid-binding Zn-ribbon protein
MEVLEHTTKPASISLPSAAFMPKLMKPGNVGNWTGHLPFARDLIASHRPGLFVELGTHFGESYFGFCQAIAENELDCKAFAIDTWAGDEHAGFYGDSTYARVSSYNEANYAGFSYLIRSRFEDAVPQFEDESIGLLHIDGLHTFEAVSHDFETWFPKVAPGGIILLHDIAIRHEDFGVWKLWDRLKQSGATFQMDHSAGLGVFEKPSAEDKRCDFLRTLFSGDTRLDAHVRRYYALSAEELESKRGIALRSIAALRTHFLLQVFNPREGQYANDPDQTVQLSIGDWHRIVIDIPAGVTSGRLRLNPVSHPCVFEIGRIELRGSVDGTRLWSVEGGLGEAAIGGTLLSLSDSTSGDAARFLNYGFDPQVYLPTIAGRFAQPLQLEISLRISESLDALLPAITAAQNGVGGDEHANRKTQDSAHDDIASVNVLRSENKKLLDELNIKQTAIYLLTDSKEALKERERELAELRSQGERELAELRDKCDSLDKSLGRELSEQRQRFDDREKEHESERSSWMTQSDNLRDEIARIGNEKGDLVQKLEALEGHYNALERDHDEIVQRHRTRLRFYEAAREHYDTKIGEYAVAQEVKDKWALELRAERDKLQVMLDCLTVEHEGLKRTFNDILGSLSWRLTAPLRGVLGLVRGRPN